MGKPLVNVYIQGHRDGNDAPYVYKTTNLVWGTDIFQQVCDENTKYVVKWVFDLKGKTLEVPKNCIFEFDGGRIQNGTIGWNNTKVLNLYDYEILRDISELGMKYLLKGFRWINGSTDSIKVYIGSGRAYPDVFRDENLLDYEDILNLNQVTVNSWGDAIFLIFTSDAYQRLTEVTMSGFGIPFDVNTTTLNGYVICTSKNRYKDGTWPIMITLDNNE